MIDLSFILHIAKKREDVFTLLQVFDIRRSIIYQNAENAAAENLFLPICRARDQTPKRRRTILPSVKATSKIDIKRLNDHLIHNVVKKNIITTSTTLFNRVFQKKHVLKRNKKRNLPSPSLGVSLNRSEKDLVLMLNRKKFFS